MPQKWELSNVMTLAELKNRSDRGAAQIYEPTIGAFRAQPGWQAETEGGTASLLSGHGVQPDPSISSRLSRGVKNRFITMDLISRGVHLLNDTVHVDFSAYTC